MTAVSIKQFRGIAPKIHPRRLDDAMSQIARNCRLDSGAFSTLVNHLQNFALAKTGEIKALYKSSVGYWLHWNGEVDVVRGATGDTSERLYYSGDGVPKVTNAAMLASGAGTAYPNDSYILGIPYATVAPGVLLGAGGSGTARLTAYVFTLVSGWSEEGRPSTASAIINAMPGQTVNVSNLGVAITSASYAAGVVTVNATAHGFTTGDKILNAGANEGDYNGIYPVTVTGVNQYTYVPTGTPPASATGTMAAFKVDPSSATGKTNVTNKYLYRVNSGVTGAEYQFVTSLPVGTTTYADSTLDSALGEILPSSDWYMPPTDLQGLAMLPNGSLVGFSVYGLCFSEPYQPHAWPIGYRIPSGSPITAIAVDGSDVVVGTQLHPFVAIGSHPSTMTPMGVPHPWACRSKRGMKALTGIGVLFPSTEGLVLIRGRSAKLVTAGVMKKDQWLAYAPDSMHATDFDNRLFLFYRTAIVNGENVGGALVFNMNAEDSAPIELSFYATATYSDPLTGDLAFVMPVAGTNYHYFYGKGVGTLLGEWKSKKINFPAPIALSAARISGDFFNTGSVTACNAANAATVAANQALVNSGDTGGGLADFALADIALAGDNLADLMDCGVAYSVTFKYFVDGVEKLSRVVTGSKPFRLPAVRGRDVEFYLSGSATVYEIAAASTMSELAQ